MAAHVEGALYRCPAPPVGCGQVKPASDFYSIKTKNNGLSHKCKECHRQQRREGSRPRTVAPVPVLAADTRIAREMLTERDSIYAELAGGTRHLLAILRKPPAALTGAPVGDVLCAADGLDEVAVSRILLLAKVTWGTPLLLLAEDQVTALCFQIKHLQPETWERWRAKLKAAA